MDSIRIRGLEPDDDKVFAPKQIEKLTAAQQELHFLLNRGCPIKSAMTFIGNHHQLTSRQSLAVMRSTAPSASLSGRENKRLAPDDLTGKTVYIDGFNQIIALEVAISDGMLFIGQDGGVRDLAELRGTYRLIPQTGTAIGIIRDICAGLNISRAVFLLDEPVSNSGRLKSKIYDTDWPLQAETRILRSPDAELKKLPFVITSDSIILDGCVSWFNLMAYALEAYCDFHRLTRFVKLDKRENDANRQ